MKSRLTPQVLVLGADQDIGFGLVGALLEAGSPVLAVGGDHSRLQGLTEHFSGEPALEAMAVDWTASDKQVQAILATLDRRQRGLRAVFACLPDSLQAGRLIDQPVDLLRQKLDAGVLPHFAAAHVLVPYLSRNEGTSHYLMIGGPHAERGWAGYGHASIATSALRMLTHVLHEESRALGVRVQMLAVDHPVRTPRNASNARSQWPGALAVGRHAVSLMTDTGPAPAVVQFDPRHAVFPPQPLFTQFSFPLSANESNP